MNVDPYCEEKGTPPGSTAYYQRLFAAPSRQPALTALYAFRTELRSIADGVSEPGAARMKVAWWQAEVQRMFAGGPEHPVTRALAGAVEEHGLDRPLFDELIALADDAIEHAGHADEAALLEHARRAAALQRLESEICGFANPATRTFAENLGTALELSRMVRDVRTEAMQGRIRIPAAELDAHDVRPADLLQPSTGGNVRALLARQADRARAHLDGAGRTLPAIDHRAQTSGLIAASIERALLAEIERDGYRVLEHRVELTPIRKLWRAWRTARRARRTTGRARGKTVQ